MITVINVVRGLPAQLADTFYETQAALILMLVLGVAVIATGILIIIGEVRQRRRQRDDS